MRTLFSSLFLSVFLVIVSAVSLHAAVYEASSLHNAVSRSETVLDLFYDRWERIQDMDLYFDLYGRINWVHNFKVYAVNQGSGQRQAVDMRLVRTYGSITINIPLLRSYSGTMQERLKPGTGDYGDIKGKEQQDSALLHQGEQQQEGLVSRNNLILGLTATGFHYGLTRESTVDRGAAGNETFTDYKYTQFFDDIFAASLLYRPYFYIHGGIIINRAIEPNDDGTMSYSNTSHSTHRYFVASNLFSFLNMNSTVRQDELEELAVGILINQIVGYISEHAGTSMPKISVTYKQIRLFNDEAYDAVWVGSAYTDTGLKTSTMPDGDRERAKLHTLALTLAGNIGNILYYDLLGEFQRPDRPLYDRRTSEEIDFSYARDLRATLGVNLLGRAAVRQGEFLILSGGISRYWDPAIPYHRDSGNDYSVVGGLFKIEGRHFIWSAVPLGYEFTVSHNHATELRKLVETVDKWVVEAGINVSF